MPKNLKETKKMWGRQGGQDRSWTEPREEPWRVPEVDTGHGSPGGRPGGEPVVTTRHRSPGGSPGGSPWRHTGAAQKSHLPPVPALACAGTPPHLCSRGSHVHCSHMHQGLSTCSLIPLQGPGCWAISRTQQTSRATNPGARGHSNRQKVCFGRFTPPRQHQTAGPQVPSSSSADGSKQLSWSEPQLCQPWKTRNFLPQPYF